MLNSGRPLVCIDSWSPYSILLSSSSLVSVIFLSVQSETKDAEGLRTLYSYKHKARPSANKRICNLVQRKRPFPTFTLSCYFVAQHTVNCAKMAEWCKKGSVS